MNHSFSVEIAKKFSIEEAIVLENLYFWIKKNQANDKHFYDGRYWTYNSQKALTELFPYWNRMKIQRVLQKLEDNGLVIKGNYNKVAYDRTTWYALTEKALFIFEQWMVQNRTIDGSEMNNRLCESEQPIPDINTDINTVKDIVEYLNEKAGTNYRHTTRKTQSLIKARLNEGFDLEDFKHVIDVKVAEWGNNPEMSKYIRPETLFSNKFEGYLNQLPVNSGPQGDKPKPFDFS